MFEADEFVDQSTPLFYAAAGGYPDIREAGSGPIEVVKSLLASGARQDLDTGGRDHISSLLLSITAIGRHEQQNHSQPCIHHHRPLETQETQE